MYTGVWIYLAVTTCLVTLIPFYVRFQDPDGSTRLLVTALYSLFFVSTVLLGVFNHLHGKSIDRKDSVEEQNRLLDELWEAKHKVNSDDIVVSIYFDNQVDGDPDRLFPQSYIEGWQCNLLVIPNDQENNEPRYGLPTHYSIWTNSRENNIQALKPRSRSLHSESQSLDQSGFNGRMGSTIRHSVIYSDFWGDFPGLNSIEDWSKHHFVVSMFMQGDYKSIPVLEDWLKPDDDQESSELFEWTDDGEMRVHKGFYAEWRVKYSPDRRYPPIYLKGQLDQLVDEGAKRFTDLGFRYLLPVGVQAAVHINSNEVFRGTGSILLIEKGYGEGYSLELIFSDIVHTNLMVPEKELVKEGDFHRLSYWIAQVCLIAFSIATFVLLCVYAR